MTKRGSPSTAVGSVAGHGRPSRPRVLIAAFDGLQPSQITVDRTPTIHRLARNGVVFARHHAVFPTVTRVNAASMMTGRHPGGHGLLGNTLVMRDWDPHRAIPALAPELRTVAEATGRVLLAPTLGEMLRPHGLAFGSVVGGTSGNAYVQHPRADQVGGAILHPEFTLPAHHHARMVARFGVWPPKRAPDLPRIRLAADVLLDYLLPEVDPDVALVWFPEPDTSQHAAGVGSAPAVEALAAADAQLGRILAELGRRGVEPDVLVVSDHGYSTVARRIQLEDVVRDAGFPPGHELGGVTVAANGGAALFYVHDSDPGVLGRLTRWLVEQPWVGALVAGGAEAAALGLLPGDRLGLGGPRAADLVLSFRWDSTAVNGFAGSADSAEGASGLGTHGSGSPHELRCTLVAHGPSFRQETTSDVPSGNVDIAPTVLCLLGLASDLDLDGRPLLEAFRQPSGPTLTASTPETIEAVYETAGVHRVHRAVVERVGHARYLAAASAERL